MICVSLAGLSYQECMESIDQSPYSEIRIDQLTLTEKEIFSIFKGRSKTIATFRPSDCTDDKRKNNLILALKAGAGFIDIEFESDDNYRKELISIAHECNASVIISFHDFEGTPDVARLDTIIHSCFQKGADIVKIVTTSHNEKNNASVLSLYEKHENIIAFCMGNTGKITRIAAPLLGAKFTYASLNQTLATAPGQITLNELKEIYKTLNITF